LGENDIEMVLQRLDRLTMEESRMTAAQTMEVVYGLFNNMKTVMDGTETLLDISFAVYRVFVLLDGKASIDNIRGALGMTGSWSLTIIADRRCQLKCNRYQRV
jgi:hypothetical protein